MADEKKLDILKGAILLEYKGKALYESVAQKSDIDAVRELFGFLVKEEEKHIELLKKQFTEIVKGNDFDAADFAADEQSAFNQILTEKIGKEVSAASYESAVIAAALELEKKAVEYYSAQEMKTENIEEKKIFKWLTVWEKEHMMMMAKLDEEIKEQVWYDNAFWPLD